MFAMTLRAYALLALLVGLGACAHPLEDAPCPCAHGYICCVAEKDCHAGSDHCAADLACGGAYGPTCSDHSQCVDTPGGGECACDEGYRGTNCQECADGFRRDHGWCLPKTVIPYCMRDDGCEVCSEVLYCDTPASVAENRGTWCRQTDCTREEALADCLDDLVSVCGGVTAEQFYIEFK
jgi:hypothetical protein